LAAVVTAVQLLAGGVADAQRASLIEMMDRQLKLMQRLLDDLLDLNRIAHGYIQLKKESVDLAEFLQRVTGLTQSTTAERRQELILRLPAEGVRFMADEARLEQIVINLLSNASKYTSPGGTIELSGAREGSEVVLRCQDNGRGIPLEMLQKIFEPFTRVEPLSDSRGEASLGIGLTLVKRLVELHGGSISVESGGLAWQANSRCGCPSNPHLPINSRSQKPNLGLPCGGRPPSSSLKTTLMWPAPSSSPWKRRDIGCRFLRMPAALWGDFRI
jgi:signal transduction histidine kinase